MSEIIYFLLGAMTIVEVVDAHQGFKIITDVINTRSRNTLMWLIGGVTFFMSAVLDNLTSTIVMVSLLRKLCPDPETRKFLGAVVVIAANAGGAWTPIGDVTTTMLWINGQISTVPTMRDLLLPSAVSLLVPMLLISKFADEVKGEFAKEDTVSESDAMAPRGKLVFAAGVGALLFVPVFKASTGLPPYLGMLTGLGAMWLLTDVIHFNEKRQTLQVRLCPAVCACGALCRPESNAHTLSVRVGVRSSTIGLSDCSTATVRGRGAPVCTVDTAQRSVHQYCHSESHDLNMCVFLHSY